MNQQLKEFFEKNEVIERDTFLKEKESILIQCGLYSTEKQYSDKRDWASKYDPETKKYCKDVKVPLDVTDDEYCKILEIYRKNNVSAAEKKKEDKVIHLESVNPHAERILNFFIVVRLIFCILLSVLFIVLGIALNDEFYTAAPIPLIAGIALAFFELTLGLVSWALQKVVINMSNNLHNVSRLTESIEKK